MAILKFRDNGEWKSIAAFKGEDGKDGAIQYKPGPGINISEDNIISATFTGEDGVDITVDAQPLPDSTNPVASGGVYTALQNKADKSEIKTDTSELTNGAGFITGGDIPKDLGDFDNEAGFLKEETDPLFSRSVAASITEADKSLWNRVGDLTFVPIHLDLNFNSATVNSINHTYKTSIYLDKILRLAGGLQKAIICITTASHSVLLHYHQTANSSSQEMITDYYGLTPSDSYGRYATIRLRIIQSQKTGAHISTQFSSMGSSYNLVTKSKVLTTDNTSSFVPTKDYHPATKKYVDDQVAAGVEGIGGIEVEEDPTVPAWVKNITEDDISNWNNKADAGGIDQELDPTVPIWVKAITEDDIASWNNKLDEIPDISGEIDDAIDNALAGAGYISEEEDPLFVNSPASSITDEDKIRWDNKLDSNNIYHKTTYAYEIHHTPTTAQVEGLIPFLKNFLFKDAAGYIVTEHLPQICLYRTLAPSSTDKAYYEIYASSPFHFQRLAHRTCTINEYIKSSESQAKFMGGKLGTYDTYMEFIMEAVNYAGIGGVVDQQSITGYMCSYNNSDARYGQIQRERITIFFNIDNVLSDNPNLGDIAIARTEYGAGFWEPGI